MFSALTKSVCCSHMSNRTYSFYAISFNQFIIFSFADAN